MCPKIQLWPTEGHTRGHKAMPAGQKTRSRLHSHLYLKGRIFYYRQRIPKRFTVSNSPKEIRVCLHTPYLTIANKIAANLAVLLDTEFEMRKKTSDSTDIQAVVKNISDKMREEVNAILAGKNKREISDREIQERIDDYLRQRLEKDSFSTELPAYAECHIPGKPVEIITEGAALHDAANDLLHDLRSGENYNDHFQKAILELIGTGTFNQDEISEENAQRIIKAYMIMQIKLNQILAARYEGNFALEQSLVPPLSVSCQNKSPKTCSPLTVSTLIDKYVSTNIADGKWKPQTVTEHKNRVLPLLEIIGDRKIDSITRDDMRTLRELLRKLPPRWKQNCKKSRCTPEELSKMEHPNTLKIVTINIIIEAISTMFIWAQREGLVEANPASNLSLKDERAKIEERDPLTDDDIKTVFFSGDYLPKKSKNPAYYWCPLISLYTGMRLEEIAQLHCEDIYIEDKHYIFDIKTESNDGLSDKILKTVNAKRKIPMHDALIDLGLITYLDTQKATGEKRLFSKLNKTKSTPKYGKQVSKQFKALLIKKGITGKKSFHSIRHSFSNFFKKRNMHTDMFLQMFGHGLSELASSQYGDRFSTTQIYDELISKLDYGNDK